jgi:hypothetical protein
MGIADMFGFGKKEKTPFKVPREVSALRTRIDAEERENYPNLGRYKEIMRDAERACENLNVLIAGKEYSEEAIRIKEDIRKKLDGLANKIKSNMREAKKEGSQDYVEKNIDYLERKSTRDKAKTLFTDFLEAYDLFMASCNEGTAAQRGAIDSATETMIHSISDLNSTYFKVHGQDREIRGLKEKLLEKAAALDAFFKEHAARLEGGGLKAYADLDVQRIVAATKKISEH